MKLIEQLSPAEVLADARARLRENWGDGEVIDGQFVAPRREAQRIAAKIIDFSPPCNFRRYAPPPWFAERHPIYGLLRGYLSLKRLAREPSMLFIVPMRAICA